MNYAGTATGPAPDNLSNLQKPSGPCWVFWDDTRKFYEIASGYRLEYHRDPPSPGRPTFAFHVAVRPDYGVTGIRSYYADESGIIRGTPQDRPATRDDPPIPECEWHERTLCSSNP